MTMQELIDECSMLQILSVTPFEKEPLIQLLTDSALSVDIPQSANQLNLF